MEFVQKFTPPDFKVKNFTPSISPYFNSFSGKKTQKMSENGEIYTAGKNFTLPPALTAWTNSTSVITMTNVRSSSLWLIICRCIALVEFDNDIQTTTLICYICRTCLENWAHFEWWCLFLGTRDPETAYENNRQPMHTLVNLMTHCSYFPPQKHP